MKTIEFTPGPWTYNRDTVRTVTGFGDPYEVRDMNGKFITRGVSNVPGQSKANAQVIALVPEMVEAIIKTYELGSHELAAGSNAVSIEELFQALEPVVEKLQADD